MICGIKGHGSWVSSYNETFPFKGKNSFNLVINDSVILRSFLWLSSVES